MLVGHQSRANPFRTRPTYQALLDLPFEERIARLKDPDIRAKILLEGQGPVTPGTMSSAMSAAIPQMFPLGEPPEYEPTADTGVAARAAREQRSPDEVVYDLMLENDGNELLLFPLLNYGGGSYDAIHEMITDPITVQGLGDGGAHCGIVCDASMTTYLLSHWVRDRSRGPRIGLEAAVQRLTSSTATLYGLDDRGVLAPGYRADVNVIDFERLDIDRPQMVHDLPAGAGRMVQHSSGYVETIVAGETVVADGELTDARPGRLVRGPQSAP
jgi:N-acyl-D-aspartate/D-glutamate deacylase